MPTPTPLPPLPPDYLSRLYAGVLGKLIGVYLGRPFEQWSHKDILARLGEVDYYVHDKLKSPLIVTDDDISGTFTFIRALEDNPSLSHSTLTANHIAQTWLNYIIKDRAILWWGGMGISTEHTAFQRLLDGVPAPQSGSIALNGPVVAEQIGSQIFIDGWGLVNPGDPERAAHFARLAASVSHDGVAIDGAVIVAALVAQAFTEPNLDTLLDTALSLIPPTSALRPLLHDLRNARAKSSDWYSGLKLIHEKYSYELFAGGCHMIPNHAVIQLALLWGGDDFQRSLMIANTAGYDTDCNSGNVGCINAVRLGLPALDSGPDFRGPVADRLLLPTADGGGCITDALTETYRLAHTAARLRNTTLPVPKNGARFHFSLPGSVQGFTPEHAPLTSPESLHACTVTNSPSPFTTGENALAISFSRLSGHRVARASTPVFITPDQAATTGYSVLASPILYPGQTVSAQVLSSPHTTTPISVRLYARHYTTKDELARAYAPAHLLSPGAQSTLTWTLPPISAHPYCDLGLEISAPPPGLSLSKSVPPSSSGTLHLNHLSISGTPSVTFSLPEQAGNPWSPGGSKLWLKQWTSSASTLDYGNPAELFRLAHPTPGGLAITGHRSWSDYRIVTHLQIHLASRALLCSRVNGLRRYYALALLPTQNQIQLLLRMDDHETILASTPVSLPLYQKLALSLTAQGPHLTATLTLPSGESHTLTAQDQTLKSGALALGIDSGRINVFPLTVSPA